MAAPKTQISPIPPEPYGERFIKFISGLTMAKEEQERGAHSFEQLDGSISNTGHGNSNQRSSFNLFRRSTDRVIEKAEKQARKSEERGATEDDRRDRTLSTMRSPSAERANGHGGATLPVVEEDREASSREESLHNEKQPMASGHSNEPVDSRTESSLHRPESKREQSVHGGQAAAILESPVMAPPQEEEQTEEEAESVRNKDGDKPPPTPEKDSKYQKHQSLPRLPPLPPLKLEATPRIQSPAQFDSEEEESSA